MEITEVRIKLMENPEDRLRGFCSVTFDSCFVIRDLKIIEGNRGPFVAMPSRKLTSNCHKCRSKNHLKARYCNQCGTKLRSDNIEHDSNGRAKLYADIAHPINAQCREAIQSRIVEELEKETQLAKEPGYRSRYDEGYDDRSRPRHNEKTTIAKNSPDESSASSEPNSANKSDGESNANVDSEAQPQSDSAIDARPVADSKPEADSTPQVHPTPEKDSQADADSQAEVETRIDIPRPKDADFSPSGYSAKRPAESMASERPDPSASRSDGDDAFGKGIF